MPNHKLTLPAVRVGVNIFITAAAWLLGASHLAPEACLIAQSFISFVLAALAKRRN